MASTLGATGEAASAAAWRVQGRRYYAYRLFLQQRFGRPVRKVSVDAGLGCPNVDGTVAAGGCVFCDNRSFSPSRRLPRQDIAGQIDEGIRRLRHRYRCEHFLAYFQPATNTYAPVSRLRQLYEQAASHPRVVGLTIGTRPDCAGNDVLDLLEEFAARTYVSVEFGLQSMHDRSLDWMNRGHHHDAFLDVMARSDGRGFDRGGHVILGLPGESRADMSATADEIARLGLNSVKLHNLYAVRNTPLAELVSRGEVRLLERDEYLALVVDFLERLPPGVVVERIGGDAPPSYLVGPSWCLDKASLPAALDAEFVRRDTWQGKRYAPPVPGPG